MCKYLHYRFSLRAGSRVARLQLERVIMCAARRQAPEVDE